MATKFSETCGKNRYTSEKSAVRSALRSSFKTGTPLRVYRCDSCQGWHLTKRALWHPSYGTRPPKHAVPAA